VATLLELEHLEVVFATEEGGETPVVRDLSLHVSDGEVVGLVGESGAGKSVTALAVVGLLPAAARIRAGSIRFAGRELTGLPESELRTFRGGRIGLAFQEPGAAANPVLSFGSQLREVMRAHLGISRAEARAKSLLLCRRLALPDPELRLRRPLAEFSGGQRQRAMLAIALAADPELLIADEPTSALDPTVQAEVLNLLIEQQRERDLSVLLISHDLAVVARTCNRIAVLYAGEMVETGPVDEILAGPRHPYTQALLRAAHPRRAESGGRALEGIAGQPPSPGALPPGCAFEPRCPFASAECSRERPELRPTGNGRSVRCLLSAPGIGTA